MTGKCDEMATRQSFDINGRMVHDISSTGCCIDIITRLVIDYEVLSKYCRLCDQKEMKLGNDSVTFSN